MSENNAEQNIALVEQNIREYLNKIKLGQLESSDEIQKYLSMNQEQLRRLSIEECNEIAFLLNKEALFIQKERNILNGKISWGNSTIDWIIVSRLSNYDKYIPYDAKRILAIKDDEYIKKLYGIVVQSQQYIESTTFITNQLKNLADNLVDLARSKRSEK